MIKSLRLTNWRAYDQLALDFDAGTTFIVAPNGVGKTSIVMGLAWGLFGSASRIEGSECVRAGSDRTEVIVSLDLHDGRRMSVTRSTPVKGRESVAYLLDGSNITNASGVEILESDFGVPIETACRLCMMRSTESAQGDALDLRDHLYRAFGVADLLESVEDAKRLLGETRKDRKTIADQIKEVAGDAEAERSRIDVIDAELADLGSQANRQRAAMEAAAAEDRLRDEWAQHDREVEATATALTEVREAAASLDLSEDNPTDLAVLDEADTAASTQVETLESRRAVAAGAAAAARHALDLLDDADEATVCPTCLRAFDGGELEDAQAQHTHAEDAGIAKRDAMAVELQALRERLREMESIRVRLAAVPQAPDPPASARPAAADPDDVESMRLDSEGISNRLAVLQADRQRLAKQVDDHDRVSAQGEVLEQSYRREALAEASFGALTEAAERLTQDRIEPLVTEVRWRWKRLFGDDGLQLRPDGSIVRVVGDRELGWESLSGGERIWARVVTHILILSVSTRLPFAWFDEPLEHLDPRMRRAVASSLTSVTGLGGPPQILVTTYEHAIARQLSAGTDGASVVNVRANETT